jgi:4-diphosphocytidyl-2-C-methyl-D-erythritol kinase
MIRTKAFAKLNLNLHVLPQKIDGYHKIKFINCQINLYDELWLEEKHKAIDIICHHPEVPKKNNNLIYKAAVTLKQCVNNQNLGARIVLKKNIPIRAGLGGASADAAEAIKGLLKLWRLRLPTSRIFKIIKSLGTDVFYCFSGGVCQVEGKGEKIISLSSDMPRLWLLIIVPEKKKPSTSWMYKHLDFNLIGNHLGKLSRLKEAIINKNKKQLIDNLYNDFEYLALRNFPVISKIKTDLLLGGALGTILAGSGLSVVGFFDSKNKSEQALKQLKVYYNNVIWTKTDHHLAK